MITKNPIGFQLAGAATNSDSKRELIEIDKIMTNLSKEVGSYKDFENTLLKELRTVRDMEANLENVNRQVLGMRKLVTTRDDIFRELMTQYQKGIAMDVTRCDTLFGAINKINQEMNANVNIAHTELSKLFVEQKHQMYSESEENKKMMNIISEEAKKLNTEIILLAEQHNSLNQRITTLYDDISKIANERQHIK